MQYPYFPETGFVRLSQIGNPKADPPVTPVLPLSKSTLCQGVLTGRFPQPYKMLGPRTTVWCAADIRALFEMTLYIYVRGRSPPFEAVFRQ